MSHRRLLPAVLLVAASASAGTYCGSGSASIPDGNGASTTWTIDVPDSNEIIVDALLQVQIDHPWIGDLSILLTAPDGTSVQLLDRPGMPDGGWIGPWGCGGDDMVCLFDDAAASDAESTCSVDAVPVLNGNLRPLSPLSTVDGLNPEGTWTIQITDASPIDSGTVEQTCLTLVTAPDCNSNGVSDALDIGSGDSQDINSNGIPDECECQADINGDLVVSVLDLLLVLDQWGCTGTCSSDITNDGVVDVQDLLLVISGWGLCS